MSCFSKQKRLRCKREFQTTFNGHKAVSREFVIYCSPRPAGVEQGRVGIIVSKKVHRHANKRNLIKRKIREACRTTVLPGIDQKFTGSWDLIVIARAGVWQSDLKSFEELLSRLSKKAVKTGLEAANRC